MYKNIFTKKSKTSEGRLKKDKKMRIILFVILITQFSGCASAPKKRKLSSAFLTSPSSNEKASKLKDILTLGDNQLTAGYSTEATLLTKALLSAEVKEKGEQNMDDKDKILKEAELKIKAFTLNTTCFMFSVHTYGIERAMFKNWVSKVKDSSGLLHEITFSNVAGVDSVPRAYQDMSGRSFHNSSTGCTSKEIDLTKSFELYIIPQMKNNQDQDETTVLHWEIQ